MITDERVEKALEFIRDNAGAIGLAVAKCKHLEQKRKTVKGVEFHKAEGTMAEREQAAYASDAFKEVSQEIEHAWYDAETLRTRLRAAELTIEIWRTQSSNQRSGVV
ncbi:MAG: hypothetical protein AAF578_00400 [Pseudomonadota bacterium]